MTTGVRLSARRSLLRLGAGLGLGLAVSACPSRSPQATDRDALCRSACATLSTSCSQVEPARCVEACSAARSAARDDGCAGQHDAYLACVSASHAPCGVFASLGSALAPGAGVLGCAEAAQRFDVCSAPCRERGVVQSATGLLEVAGRSQFVQVEQINAGCRAEGAKPMRRSEAGAPCQAASVCSQVRCPCPRARLSALVRACIDGRCATESLACNVVPRAVAHDVCKKRPLAASP